ncbi:MAG: hypothetical protein KDJ74_01665 [Notoacmeibacter sp.]|nr:hypothetical protein [Notoacmeibacter sp.]
MASDHLSPGQLPLDLSVEPGHGRDELVVSQANSGAVTLIDSWPDWPSAMVVLAGPAGSGKTHLAAIWQDLSGALVLPHDGLGLESWDGEGVPAFLVDDADQPGLDETGLFHLINMVRQNGGTLLLTARRFPGAWGVALPDLASRLKAATTVEIAEPDDLLLSGVIMKLFADRQISVDAAVITYLARRMERSLAAANAVVDALDRLALSRRCRITRQLAAEVLDAFDTRQGELF